MKNLLQIVAVSGVIVASAQAQVTLLNDSFDDGDRTNGVDAIDTQWYIVGGGTTESAIGNTINSYNGTSGALRVTGKNTFSAQHQWAGSFNATTLAVGDSIKLTLTYASSDTTNAATALRFGLMNSGGTKQSSDLSGANADSLYTDDVGYAIWAPRHSSANPIQLYTKNVTSTQDSLDISAGASTALPGTANTSGSTAGSAGPFVATLTLTRTATGYDYSSTYGGATLNNSTTVVNTDTFDTVVLFSALAGNGITASFDDISVVYTSAVPEPSTYAMIAGVAGLAGAMFRRRRSSAA